VVIDITKYCGATRHWNTHTLACEIAQNKHLPIEFDLQHEHWDVDVNGIRAVIQDCYDALGIEQEIKFTNTNTISNLYKWMLHFNTVPCTNIRYGQFFVRPTNERMLCHYKHLTWKHRSKGIATLHFNPNSLNVESCDFKEFLWEYPDKWHVIKDNFLPYADIKCKHDAQHHHGSLYNDYFNIHQAYSEICVEVVCETNTVGNTYFITEKTLRPMLNGCIPLIVANAGYESHLKSLGFDMFDDVLDKSYDLKQGADRIEGVYAILEGLLIHKDKEWLEQLAHRLQHNIDKVRSYIQENIA